MTHQTPSPSATVTAPHSGRYAHLATPPLASMVSVTPSEGRAERCSWCPSPSVVKIVDHSWLDYACQAHAIEWYPTEYRLLVPQTDMTKTTDTPAPWDQDDRKCREAASRLLRGNNLMTLASEFRMRVGYGWSLFLAP